MIFEEKPYDRLRRYLYEYHKDTGNIFIWHSKIKEYLHQRNIDYNIITSDFLEYEVSKGFLENYGNDGYKFTRKGLVVYNRIVNGKKREEPVDKKIKSILNDMDYGNGLSLKEICEVLQISESTARKHIQSKIAAKEVSLVDNKRPFRYSATGQKRLF